MATVYLVGSPGCDPWAVAVFERQDDAEKYAASADLEVVAYHVARDPEEQRILAEHSRLDFDVLSGLSTPADDPWTARQLRALDEELRQRGFDPEVRSRSRGALMNAEPRG